MTRSITIPRSITIRRRTTGAEVTGTSITGTKVVGARLLGPSAMGPLAIAASAVGALAIGRLAIANAVIGKLRAAEIEVGSLKVRALEVAGRRWPDLAGSALRPCSRTARRHRRRCRATDPPSICHPAGRNPPCRHGRPCGRSCRQSRRASFVGSRLLTLKLQPERHGRRARSQRTGPDVIAPQAAS